MSKKGSAYYHVSTSTPRQWTPLGSDLKKALKAWADIEGSRPIACTGMAAVIERYRLEIIPEKAERTQVEYRRACSRLTDVFGHMEPQDITIQHIYGYLDHHANKVTANREVAVLSAIFTKAMRWGVVKQNPCRGIERNKEKPRKRRILEDELSTLRAGVSPFVRSVVDLAYLTAARKGDLLRIRLSDLQDEGLYIEQHKTGQRQLFEWTDALREAVEAAKALPRRIGSIFLFSTRTGQPYTVSGFDSIWQRQKTKLGLENFHFHDIRGKAITDAKEQRGIDYAQTLAGHASSSQTEDYVSARTVTKVKPLR